MWEQRDRKHQRTGLQAVVGMVMDMALVLAEVAGNCTVEGTHVGRLVDIAVVAVAASHTEYWV